MTATLALAFILGCLTTYVVSDSIVILGGEVNSILNPSISQVESFGPCGLFESGIPELDNNIREFSAVLYGTKIVICGGMGLLSSHKECYSLELDTWPMVWQAFPPLNHGRHNFGLVVVGERLFAMGGAAVIGSVRSIEEFDPATNAWTVRSEETNGFREDFCTLPWGDDGILVIGGYDDFGQQTRTELFNITSGDWRQLAPLNIGRGFHACAPYKGGVMVGGGWVFNNDPDYPGQVISKSVEWYNATDDTWTEITSMRHGRSEFALEVVNGTLTAVGGFEGDYLDTIEMFVNEEGWEYSKDRLNEHKAGFASLRVETLLEEAECASNQ